MAGESFNFSEHEAADAALKELHGTKYYLNIQ
jgi:hypothetical protein